MDYKKISELLFDAGNKCYQIEPLTDTYPNISVEDAYRIQLEGVALKRALGEKIIGLKVGLTSKAVQKMLGVNEPDYGHLTDRMLIQEGQVCKIKNLIQPKAEGELAFCLKDTLKGPGVTIADVYNATSYVVPAIEIVDSRISNWKIKLEDTISDNGSSAMFVLGSRFTPIDQIDMRLIGMNFEKNGELIASGTGAEVWGNPAAAVAWLANKLSEFDIELNAGSIIMSGSFTAMSSVVAGDIVTISFAEMGSLSLKFE